MEIEVVTPKVTQFIRAHNLELKWEKAIALLRQNRRHPSLHTELLEPKDQLVYSFRLDRKYRVLFAIKGNTAFIFRVTNHYQ